MAAEVAQGEVMYAAKAVTVWRAVMNWLGLLLQLLVQMVRLAPSLSQVLSFLGFRLPLLSSSSPPSSTSFKPLPVVELPPHRDSTASRSDNVSASDDAVEDDQTIEKLTVVLDLDETLVCAYETSSLPPIVRIQATEAGLKWFDLECVSSEKECDGRPKVNLVTVFERPGLREFLRKTSEFADLVLFTAGLEGYAKPLVDRIDIENLFGIRLYRPATISTPGKPPKEVSTSAFGGGSVTWEYREHVKDLSCLSKDLSRTVIVDNNPFSFLLQPLNGIPCIPFSAGQPYDEQLLEVLLPLLKHLSLQKDIRPVLYERFHMPEWFQKHGIPASKWAL